MLKETEAGTSNWNLNAQIEHLILTMFWLGIPVSYEAGC